MSKITGFLDLPREVRDQIYNLVLVSPTNLVEVACPYPASSSLTNGVIKRPQEYRLTVNPASGTSNPPPPSLEYTLPSLSICRTNQQIYHETKHIFYERNALFVSYPFRPTIGYPDLLQIMKIVGHPPSRSISKIILDMPKLGDSYRVLYKLIEILVSRSLQGDLKTFELRWQDGAWTDLIERLNRGWGFDETLGVWSLFLQSMHDIRRLCKFDKVIIFPSQDLATMEDSYKTTLRNLALSLNEALGGKLFWGDVCVAKDGQQLGTVWSLF